LGAGGAARAIAASLAAGGATEIILLNRTLSRATEAATSLSQVNPESRVHGGSLGPEDFSAWAEEADLVVNCLGGGANAAVEALPMETLAPRAIWADINYWMPSPPQLEACRARGIRVSTGLGMLVHQGALSFELFTGHPIDVATLHTIVAAARKGSDPMPPDLG
jgi:shikimate dehydrogenase